MDAPTSSGEHVLMKDQSRIKKAVRRTTIVVNSRDRNYLSYPNSNHFRYRLRRPLTNVLSIELMNGVIPAYIYNINTGWNSFDFLEGTKTFLVTLTPGFYTQDTLCSELQLQLNAISGKQNIYTITLNLQTSKIKISSTNVVAYSFLFYSGKNHDEIDLNTFTILSINTPGRLLGFGLNDYPSSNGIVLAPLPMDINNFSNRIYLHLESDGKNLSRMELGSGRQDCFHIFYLNDGSNYKFLDKETDHSIYESSPAPLARVSNLEITMRDEFNRLVDLQFRELNLVFEITHLE
jgi:hypothetical protein